MNNEMTYSQAITELETIVSEIEQDDVPVDELLKKVKRASDLITYCKAKLTKTEDEVHSVLESIQEDEVAQNPEAEEEEPSAVTEDQDTQQQQIAEADQKQEYAGEADSENQSDEAPDEESDEEVPF